MTRSRPFQPERVWTRYSQSSRKERYLQMTPTLILITLALLFAVLSIPFSQYPLLAVSVILLSVAMLIGARG